MRTLRLFRMHLRVPFLLLSVAEFAICAVVIVLVATLDLGGVDVVKARHVGVSLFVASLSALAISLSVAAMGLYQSRFRETPRRALLRTLAGFVCGGAAIAWLGTVFPSLHPGRYAFTLALPLAFVLVALLHLAFFSMIEHERFKVRVLVLGAGERAATIDQRLRRQADRRGFRVIGYVPLDGESGERFDGELLIERGKYSVPELCDWFSINEIVTTSDEAPTVTLPTEELLEARLNGVCVTDIVAFHEREQGKLPLELLPSASLVYADGFDHGVIKSFVKRQFDVLTSLLLLAIVWPVMLLAALAIRLEEGWRAPILYRQTRVGLRGKPFEVLKFRSMRTDAEADGVALWARAKDPRVTRVGELMRKFRIDELPQLFNVLLGHMSIIGPRPERPPFVAQLKASVPYYDRRHAVRPGVTGWAQICYPYGASIEDAMRKQEFDLFYVKNYSILLDFAILLQTVEVVLFKHGQAR